MPSNLSQPADELRHRHHLRELGHRHRRRTMPSNLSQPVGPIPPFVAKARVSWGPKSRLPDEIEAEILLRLPVKTLIRFKSVCKSWYALISSSHFHQEHFRLAQRHPLLLTLHSRDSDLTLCFSSYNNKEGALTLAKKFSKALPHAYDNGSVRGKPFVQSCLGLVCIASWRALPILICNPSTEELVSLPIQESNDCVGFGYSASTREFKVVRFFHSSAGTCCEVFTLGDTHWRIRRPVPFLLHEGAVPFLHGAFHLLPQVSSSGVRDTDHVRLFDIETEEYRGGIRLPDYYYGLGDCQDIGIVTIYDFMRLTNLGGSLCLTFDFGEMARRLELWILKDYNNVEWVKLYNIDLSSVVPYQRNRLSAYPVENKGGESVLLNVYDDLGVKLLRYDPEEEIATLKIDKEWAATLYVESLYKLREGWSVGGNF